MGFFQAGGYVPQQLEGNTVVSGGVAITVASGPINGGFVMNPASSSGQGISASENVYLDMVNSPGSVDSAGNGTTMVLSAGEVFSLPSLGGGVIVRVNAATSGHKLAGEVW